MSFIKDIAYIVINSYPQVCPLHKVIKDILYMQAQQGRAGISLTRESP